MGTFQLEIKRLGQVIYRLEIDENTIYSGEFLGMDKVTSNFIVSSPLDLRVDDYIEHNGRTYKLKTAVPQDDIDAVTHRYDLTFYGRLYDLYNTQIKHLKRTKFTYTGTPLELLSLIVDCLNEREPGYSIGDCSDISEPQTFDFEMQSCRTALSMVAEKFKLEYYLDDQDKFYLLPKVGVDQNITMQAGRSLGLYNASRKAVDQDYATVWYCYGGTQNLPDGYRDGMDRIALSDPILKNTALYGYKEGSVIFEDVYPRRTSTITAVNGLNEVVDTTLDFDINAQNITDGGAKIVFKSGELSGQQFVITGYNHTTKTIRFGTNKDETGYQQPNDTFKAAVGDKYTLIGLVMPQSYVDAAEAEVMALGQAHANKNSFPPVAFPLNIDEKFIRDMGYVYKLIPGDTIHVVSASLGVDTRIRLQSVSYPLVNPAKIEGVVSDVIQYTDRDLMIKDIKQNKKETSKGQKTALYARQVADEVKNAAILQQFKQTYVGERAILTGAFVAGNPESGEVAGISGTDDNLEAVRIWAGASFENRGAAPFLVKQNGDAVFRNATLQSSATGQRIEIDSVNNRMRFYDSLNNLLIDLDDDTAFEGYSIFPNPPGPPIVSKVYGPGIRFGLETGANGFVTVGRKGARTNGFFEVVNEDGDTVFIVEGLNERLRSMVAWLAEAPVVIQDKINVEKAASVEVQDGADNYHAGIDYEADVRVGGTSFVHMKWIKGVLVEATPL
ncbi:phage tail protein [Pedobacter zeae]|uniref:Prophage tail endopeptidase domain-containing protein n=1 Tax=Pedobacter zeae TaxID=1737356 RepID=A0A7W6P4B5_9SPHI|nr:phage tail protein [Pedobacter zeae]MBB4106613.1 hypothetical protein [Pedobacter zeae]GGH02719.1 hypothetical protein GCM10007422_17330 [Pedobacter zeae]